MCRGHGIAQWPVSREQTVKAMPFLLRLLGQASVQLDEPPAVPFPHTASGKISLRVYNKPEALSGLSILQPTLGYSMSTSMIATLTP